MIFIFCTTEKVSHLKKYLVAMFFFCNTHYVVAAAQMPFSGGAEFEFAAPSIRPAVLLNGPNLSTPPPHPPLARLNECR